MGLFREKRIDRAHVRVLESTHVALAFLAETTRSYNSSQTLAANQVFTESLNVLDKAYRGDPLSYLDYESVITVARKIGSMVWNPRTDGAVNTVAAMITKLDETGWQLDNEREQFLNRTIEVPDVAQRLKAERAKLGEVNEAELSPFERLARESSLRAIGEAMNAAENLHGMTGQTLAPEQRALAKLNIEFVSEPVLSAWLHSIATSGVLPKDPSPIYRALDDVEAHFHASAEVRERLTEAWLLHRPDLDEQWVAANVSALLSSACSTKLDSLHQSSVDVVRELVRSTYQTQALEAQQAERQTQTTELEELRSALEAVNSQLHRLEGRLPNGVTQTAVQETKVLAERLTAKADALLEQAPDGASPSL